MFATSTAMLIGTSTCSASASAPASAAAAIADMSGANARRSSAGRRDASVSPPHRTGGRQRAGADLCGVETPDDGHAWVVVEASTSTCRMPAGSLIKATVAGP